jgi:hypothetical protein
LAEVIVRQLIDDIDGSEIRDGGGERVEFSFRGVDYQIDLSAENAAKLEKALTPYIEAAAKVRSAGRPRRSKLNGSGKSSPEQLAAIRVWARNNGHEVAERGRIKAEIVEAFEAAH